MFMILFLKGKVRARADRGCESAFAARESTGWQLIVQPLSSTRCKVLPVARLADRLMSARRVLVVRLRSCFPVRRGRPTPVLLYDGKTLSDTYQE